MRRAVWQEGASMNAQNGGEVMVNLEAITAQITESARQIADINGVIDNVSPIRPTFWP